MINHAKEKGASEKILSELNYLDYPSVYQVVYILYGEPEKWKALDNRQNLIYK